jgi:CheY-like chemotaxis protein
MGGEIQVESRPDVGSRFWFELQLPVIADTPSIGGGARSWITGYEGRRKTVLLIDDVVENRKVLVDLLAPLGFTVLEAENGREGLGKANELLPDLVITDYLMPIMDGEELTHRLRGQPKTRHIPTIMLSARVSSGNNLARLAAAADAFMTKPVDLEQLLGLIQKLLGLDGTLEPAAERSAVHIDAPVVTPPAHEMETLHRFAREGNMRKVIQWAERLTATDERYRPFAEQLTELAKRYQSRALLQLVESHLERALGAM